MVKALSSHSQSGAEPRESSVLVRDHSQSGVLGHHRDHGLEAPYPVVQNHLPSPLAHLITSAAYSRFPLHAEGLTPSWKGRGP